MTSPETLELEAVDAALAGRYVAPEHAELAELALLLRDDRPAPTAAFGAQLDRRVAAGFRGSDLRRRRPPRVGTWWKPLAVAASVLLPLLVAITLIGGSGSDDSGDAGGGSSSSSGGLAAPESAEPETGVSGVARDDASGGGSRAAAPQSDRRSNRSVQRSASLTLVAPRRDIDDVAAKVGSVTAELGGFVAASSVNSSQGGSLQLRVPSDKLDAAIARISKLGRVRDLTRNSVDITSQVVSARERLTDARTERVSLLRQLAQADTVNETESIRARLRIVSREIAAARSSLRQVKNRADFADVAVALVPRRGGAGGGTWTPGDAFDDAKRVLEVAAGVAVIATAVLLPVLIAALLGWLARRGVVRRRRERALDMA